MKKKLKSMLDKLILYEITKLICLLICTKRLKASYFCAQNTTPILKEINDSERRKEDG